MLASGSSKDRRESARRLAKFVDPLQASHHPNEQQATTLWYRGHALGIASAARAVPGPEHRRSAAAPFLRGLPDGKSGRPTS